MTPALPDEWVSELSTTIDFDHTSIAVDDLATWTSVLIDRLGAVELEHEDLEEFSYRLFGTGSGGSASRIELIAPAHPESGGFLNRFLARRGSGMHHLTFIVPDVTEYASRIAGIGFTVTGVDLTDPTWHEAFIAPDPIHGVVIQIANSAVRRPCEISPTGADRSPPGQARTRVRATTLYSTDLDRSRALFGGVLNGHVDDVDQGFVARWDSGTVCVRPRAQPGFGPLLTTWPVGSCFTIGSATLLGAGPASCGEGSP